MRVNVNGNDLYTLYSDNSGSVGSFESVEEDIGGIRGFIDFINKIGEEGLFYAIYDKSFFDVTKDFFKELFRDIGLFILGNGDAFFLAPAILFMFGTFLIGRNKFTRWILPLWFLYFISVYFHKMILSE